MIALAIAAGCLAIAMISARLGWNARGYHEEEMRGEPLPERYRVESYIRGIWGQISPRNPAWRVPGSYDYCLGFYQALEVYGARSNGRYRIVSDDGRVVLPREEKKDG